MLLPDYACAIISVDSDSYLLEQRDDKAQFAAGMLTCFGGRRNADESPIDCLQRELHEELHWQAAALNKVCALWVGEHYIADFFHCTLNVDLTELRFEKNRCGQIIHIGDIPNSNISPWHRAVFDAYHAHEQIVKLKA